MNQNVTTLHDLLDYDLRRLLGAEAQLKSSLPGWINKAVSIKLKGVMQKYQGFVEDHLQKMETILQDEKIEAFHFGNRVMEAIIAETEEQMEAATDTAVRDVGLLAAVQLINHYKISTYGTATAFANALGMTQAATVLHEAEINEKQIDDRLSQLAEHEINMKAISPILLSAEKE